MLLTDSHVAMLKTSSSGPHISYKPKWAIRISNIQTVRGVCGASRLLLVIFRRSLGLGLGLPAGVASSSKHSMIQQPCHMLWKPASDMQTLSRSVKVHQANCFWGRIASFSDIAIPSPFLMFVSRVGSKSKLL